MKLTLDVENTVTQRDGKMHLDPFEPENSLTMIGVLTDQGDEQHFPFDHADVPNQQDYYDRVQQYLDMCTILICHNAAYDLLWLWESGFKYDGPVFDTMLAEYVLQRGQKEPLSLEACAERYELETKKQDTLKEYFKQGYTTRDIPYNELCEYLSADLHATQQLADKLYYRLNTPADSGLMETVILTNQVAVCLARIYQRGFKVDKDALSSVRTEFEQEKIQLTNELQKQVSDLMGDTPVNLNSPEQLSQVIYSRKPVDKAMWQNCFDPYMKKDVFKDTVRENSELVFKTKAKQCPTCYGRGKVHKTKKNGTPYAKPSTCKDCAGVGFHFIPTNEIAGLRFSAPTAKWVSAHGFTTSKTNLDILESFAKEKNMDEAMSFLHKVKRLSALDTYLSSFVEGIETFTKPDGKLHVRLLQHRTATGRFSGADPNMQNMPRGGTFPVKKVFVSRFDGGKIMEADFAQLEFRAAAYLSQDGVAIEEVSTGFDVHAYTAKVISDAGQPTSRQDAKAHTFAPLYGATGFGRTPAEAEYYTHFTDKYQGVANWHTRLAKEAVTTHMITTPSGRQFYFPNVTRRQNGTVTNFTQIKNYPVQSFATADIVPLTLLYIDKQLENMHSCIVNTVHDSIVIDIHPDEEQRVIDIINETNNSLTDLVNTKFKIQLNVPLLLEAKIGPNWLDTKDVA
ncbi:MAG: DNA polymerase [Candidatus Thorarchaeota archaeon]|jgi:DNA polymerase I-like protein with 3'-5' exonuclease and polymerase domains